MLENKYDWMEEKTYFKEELEIIKKYENYIFFIFESKGFKSIVTPILKAIERKKSPFLVRAPLYQVLSAKLYIIFKA